MSTLGYGEHHNERVLLRISEAGGGRYHYIPDPVVCESELAQALAAQGDVVVDMIEFSLTLEEGVEILRFLGKPHVRLGHSNCKFSVPDLIDGQRYVVALELSLPRRSEPGQLAVLRAHASFRCAGSDTVESLERTLVVSVGADISCVLPEVRAAVLQVRAEEARWEARKLADSRQFERAALTLKKITRLLERETSYMTNDGSSLSELVEQIHDETRALESVRSDAEYKSIRRAQMGELISVGGPLSPDSGPMSSRFFDAVAGELPQAHLTILEGSAVGDCFKLTSPKMFIGRTPAAQIRLDDQSISRMQGMLRAQGGVFYLEQLASSPPMYVNGVEIERPRLLKAGDVISVGIFTIIYEEV
jgi:Ca-activated chloride channel family protein